MKNKTLTIKFIFTIKINNHFIDYRTSKLRQNPSFLHIIYKTIWINYSSIRGMPTDKQLAANNFMVAGTNNRLNVWFEFSFLYCLQ
ncbi:hypothetical protein ESCOMM265M1_23740 [Escherichia coli]